MLLIFRTHKIEYIAIENRYTNKNDKIKAIWNFMVKISNRYNDEMV